MKPSTIVFALGAVVIATAPPGFAPVASASLYEVTTSHFNSIAGTCGTVMGTDSGPANASRSDTIPQPPQGQGWGVSEGTSTEGTLGGHLEYSINTSCCISSGSTTFGGCTQLDLTIDDIVITGPGSTVATSFNAHVTGSGSNSMSPTQCIPNGLGAGHNAKVVLTFGASRVLNFQGTTDVVEPSFGRTVNVGEPVSLSIELRLSGGVTAVRSSEDCTVTTSSFTTDYAVGFPTNMPVFNLPVGYTANSADGKIVDNMYVPGTVGVLPEPRAGVLRLQPAAPNPFSARSVLAFEMTRGAIADVSVFDVSGKRVRRLLNGFRAAGLHVVTWDGRNELGALAASGVYFYRVSAAGDVRSSKVVFRTN